MKPKPTVAIWRRAPSMSPLSALLGVPTNVGQVPASAPWRTDRRLKASEYGELRSLGEEIAEACAREPDCRWTRTPRLNR